MAVQQLLIHLDEPLYRELKGFVAYRGITIREATTSALRLMLHAQGAEHVERPACDHSKVCWGTCGKEPKRL